MADLNEQLEQLARGAVELHSREDLAKKLAKGRPLRVKLGVDPTMTELHLGHTVVLNKLRAFQDRGHVAILIIGDFTGRVGDPSGRDRTRPLLSPDELRRNAETFWEQAAKVLKPSRTDDLENKDPGKTVVVRNSSWLDPFVTDAGGEGRVSELFRVLSSLTVSRLLEREDFQTRLQAGHPLSMLEFLYPVFQAYDSVAVRSDVELGGSDQLFNLLVGRDLQRRYRERMAWDADEPPQVALTMPLLVGTDGAKKMSKSYANYVSIQDPPGEIFGKVMRISDELMKSYYELLSRTEPDEVAKLHPMEAKKRLAAELTSRFHGEEAGDRARAEFERVFSKKELPSDLQSFPVTDGNWTVVDTLVASGMAASKKEANRMILQGGLKIDDVKVERNFPVRELEKDESVWRFGSRTVRRIVKKLIR